MKSNLMKILVRKIFFFSFLKYFLKFFKFINLLSYIVYIDILKYTLKFLNLQKNYLNDFNYINRSFALIFIVDFILKFLNIFKNIIILFIILSFFISNHWNNEYLTLFSTITRFCPFLPSNHYTNVMNILVHQGSPLRVEGLNFDAYLRPQFFFQ